MRSQQVVPAGTWDAGDEQGAVALDWDLRHRRRIVLELEGGDELLVDLPEAVRLRDGDGLLLDGGGVVRVVAAEEALLEIGADDAEELARIAWHLGNRHLPVQLVAGRLRIRADHVIADMIAKLGGHAHTIEAPFDPEPGAYAGEGGDAPLALGHGHGHGHLHDDE